MLVYFVSKNYHEEAVKSAIRGISARTFSSGGDLQLSFMETLFVRPHI
jgi:hypothetical protein